MTSNRILTGYRLQALIGASCCSHAELVCEQVQAMYPELSVDWVGTGTNGRSDAQNALTLAKFCPPKKDGKRNQADIKLDVLVHVGMAGEGLDTVFVSEVIHLNPANRNNSNDQENGRAARYLPNVTGYINVESGTEYAKDFLGSKIELAFDTPPNEKPDDDEDDEDPIERELPELPEEPSIKIIDCECIEINTGEVQRMKGAISSVVGLSIDDPKVEARAIEVYKNMRLREAEQFNDRAIVEQWSEAVANALSVVTRRAIREMTASTTRIDRGLIGDIKKRINTRKKRALGKVDKDVELLKQHYNWLQSLDAQIIKEGIPSWLQ
jgi:hypothetical protein